MSGWASGFARGAGREWRDTRAPPLRKYRHPWRLNRWNRGRPEPRACPGPLPPPCPPRPGSLRPAAGPGASGGRPLSPPPQSSPYHPRAARPRGLPGHLRCLRLRRDPLLHLHPPPGDGGQMSGLCGNARRLRRPGRRQGPRGVIQCTCATLTGPHEPRAGRPTGRTPRRQPAHISRTTPASNPSSRAPSSSARRVEAPSPPQLECYGPRPPPLLAALRPRTTGIGGPAGSVPGPAEALPCGGGQPRCGGS